MHATLMLLVQLVKKKQGFTVWDKEKLRRFRVRAFFKAG